MSSIIWRVIVAVVAVVLAWQLIPPVFEVIGLDLSSAVLKILRICIGALALFYIFRGPAFPWARE